ncbi:phosphodiesterase [Modestobacter lapidis]|nr:phosphodiesterase [Modestobacter lapidis]
MPDLVDLAGRAVAVPLAALTRVRGAKPMHPRGALCSGVLHRTGPPRPWGIDWLDERRVDRVLVRFSRGAGLPGAWPDVLGLVVRLPGDGSGARPVDLLLSSTGRGRWTRRVPVLRRDAATAYGSIMSYRSVFGPVQLAALPEGSGVPTEPAPLAAAVAGRPLRFTLVAALEGGAWEPFARLRVGNPLRPLDPELHVDAVLHAPPGLRADGPLARFRRPAYAAARRVRAGAGLEPGSMVPNGSGG